MPWRHPSPLDQNPHCSADDLRARLAITALGPVDHLRRKTG